ncbi:Farnesyl diphosphate synthase [termite gut metagenome]|uniref:Farnesyl diphosphate synthase n=1 Tax=termite gut metagenome TaxID=433724 RepID=A0A5J4RQQ4_9ZZZZ
MVLERMDKTVVEKKPVHAVPQSFAARNRLRKIIEEFVDNLPLVPPLSMNDLSELSQQLIAEYDLSEAWRGWLMVEINNCVWKETVAAVPYDKRMLLLPQCLSSFAKCQAEIDELGLLCHRCNSCSIPGLQDKAESLGMMSIVAEGFTSVMGLLESGVIHTVIGVSCLDSLERAFPLMVSHGVPGIAIPLNQAGCKDTKVDYQYIESLMCMHSTANSGQTDYEKIKDDIKAWFSKEALSKMFGTDITSSLARDWLSGDGKRWRPYLLVSIFMAISGKKEIPEPVRQAAIAVECFHKASLVHDDIQDNDAFRYGTQTVHSLHGVPLAINVGDILLGEGYRILSLCNRMELVTTAAVAHISLCKGQGLELQWSRSPQELTLAFVLEIFCNKTVPAFEVALDFGVLCAGDDKRLRSILHDYSHALGIAYQLQDDVEDFEQEKAPLALRPSAVLAVLCEQNKHARYIHRLSAESDIKAFLLNSEHKPRLLQAIQRIRDLAESYHQQAIASLNALNNTEMKRLLFRVTERILKPEV